MSETLINLIIQLFAGAAGGSGVAKANKSFDLGPIANAIIGALGGAGGGSLLSSLVPALAAPPAMAASISPSSPDNSSAAASRARS